MGERVAFVGSRSYPDEALVRRYVRMQAGDVTVVSGGAQGPDTWAADEARLRGLAVDIYRPDWSFHGKAAGFVRNNDIVAACDRVVAFWDGRSRGTLDTITKAVRAGKAVLIPSGGEEEEER